MVAMSDMPQTSALKAYRDATSETLEALATKIGVHKTTLMRWESGEVPLPVDRLAAVESVTGIHRSKLRPDIFGSVPQGDAA